MNVTDTASSCNGTCGQATALRRADGHEIRSRSFRPRSLRQGIAATGCVIAH